jgi:hypothetical protein
MFSLESPYRKATPCAHLKVLARLACFGNSSQAGAFLPQYTWEYELAEKAILGPSGAVLGRFETQEGARGGIGRRVAWGTTGGTVEKWPGAWRIFTCAVDESFCGHVGDGTSPGLVEDLARFGFRGRFQALRAALPHQALKDGLAGLPFPAILTRSCQRI